MDTMWQVLQASEMKYATAIAIAFGTLFSQVTLAQPKAPITRKIIERQDIAGTPDELEMILIEYQPGAEAPPHVHPVVGLVYIIEGAAESQYEGEPGKIFHAGDSYQDLANKTHVVFRNTSKTKPLRFVVACKIPKTQQFSVPLAQGGKP
jgi:quercetin dioxygenase-like cupin family protein